MGGGKTDALAQAWSKPNPEAIVRRLMANAAASRVEPGDHRKFHNLKLATSVSNTALVLSMGNFHAA